MYDYNKLVVRPHSGRWSVKDIKPTATGEPQEVRVKVRINDNGLILVTSASIVEKKAKEPETQPPAAGDNAAPENGNNMDTTEVSFAQQTTYPIN